MRKFLVMFLAIMLVVPLAGCGNTLQQDYDAIATERDKLKTEYDTLQKKYDALQTAHNQLKADTKDWLQLSEEEKAAKIAQAEADRIAAEEAARIAKEEQEAAEAALAEEAARLAAEEAAAKEAEEKLGYETGITYENLARDPEIYKGKKVKFTGKVLQVIESTFSTEIRLATKENSWGGYIDDVIYLVIDNALIMSRILDNDIITIYGVSDGLYSYMTVMGATMTIPKVDVDKFEY